MIYPPCSSLPVRLSPAWPEYPFLFVSRARIYIECRSILFVQKNLMGQVYVFCPGIEWTGYGQGDPEDRMRNIEDFITTGYRFAKFNAFPPYKKDRNIIGVLNVIVLSAA